MGPPSAGPHARHARRSTDWRPPQGGLSKARKARRMLHAPAAPPSPPTCLPRLLVRLTLHKHLGGLVGAIPPAAGQGRAGEGRVGEGGGGLSASGDSDAAAPTPSQGAAACSCSMHGAGPWDRCTAAAVRPAGRPRGYAPHAERDGVGPLVQPTVVQLQRGVVQVDCSGAGQRAVCVCVCEGGAGIGGGCSAGRRGWAMAWLSLGEGARHARSAAAPSRRTAPLLRGQQLTGRCPPVKLGPPPSPAVKLTRPPRPAGQTAQCR